MIAVKNLVYDIAIVGGGINGCGIARDAAGRGWSVFLCEKGDLASATSSASTKLIHGGLRYLEYYKFRLVREALMERETLWKIAPHIIWPLRFVLPYQKGLRPAWLLRLGLFIYDHLGGRKLLPPTRTLNLQKDVAGGPLKPGNKIGFEYSDCWVEDSRLVTLNAVDAAERGARIAPRVELVSAARDGQAWALQLKDTRTGALSKVRARTLVNAAGPWVGDVLSKALKINTTAPVRHVKGSHIVVDRLYDHDRCYFFQNADNRIFFAIPYEQDFTLIGTTDLDYDGELEHVTASQSEIDYLCSAANEYFKKSISADLVKWSYSGVRPLYDDGVSEAKAATRDYVLDLNAQAGSPALLNIYGGKITTYRKLAESAIAKLSPYLPRPRRGSEGWTARTPLPGGDFQVQAFDAQLRATQSAYSFLDRQLATRLVRAYGTKVPEVLDGARSAEDLGLSFGAGLSEAEVRYLMRVEWAMTAEDVVWRRSKLGLKLTAVEIETLDLFMKQQGAAKSRPAAISRG